MMRIERRLWSCALQADVLVEFVVAIVARGHVVAHAAIVSVRSGRAGRRSVRAAALRHVIPVAAIERVGNGVFR
jgi:hypothetical protein